MQQFYYATYVYKHVVQHFYPLFSICFDICVPRFDSALLLIFWQLLRFYSDFQFLYIGTLLRKVNGSSSFCKGPRTSKVSDFASPKTFVKTTTPIDSSQ